MTPIPAFPLPAITQAVGAPAAPADEGFDAALAALAAAVPMPPQPTVELVGDAGEPDVAAPDDAATQIEMGEPVAPTRGGKLRPASSAPILAGEIHKPPVEKIGLPSAVLPASRGRIPGGGPGWQAVPWSPGEPERPPVQRLGAGDAATLDAPVVADGASTVPLPAAPVLPEQAEVEGLRSGPAGLPALPLPAPDATDNAPPSPSPAARALPPQAGEESPRDVSEGWTRLPAPEATDDAPPSPSPAARILPPQAGEEGSRSGPPSGTKLPPPAPDAASNAPPSPSPAARVLPPQAGEESPRSGPQRGPILAATEASQNATPSSSPAAPPTGAPSFAPAPVAAESAAASGSRVVSAPATARMVAAVTELQRAAPPQVMVVEIAEMGDLRVQVALRHGEVHIALLDGGGSPDDARAWLRDVATALSQRGFDLATPERHQQPGQDQHDYSSAAEPPVPAPLPGRRGRLDGDLRL